ncbi:UDP-N-acetylmuramoyl-tripeptide--D-alanyl-D-alanine ligase [Acetobacteraceae bacterium]|nr:UDP-N-acetylmuramoyl-tripeptide--D-alanyl-D-alanine ligase [Acetobacteraceae bacterium]
MSLLWNREQLEKATGGKLKTDVAVTGIAINSLELKKGDLFIALQGGRKDAHLFIEKALEAGASCIMADNQKFLKENNLLSHEKILLVKDCIQALTKMASFARENFTGHVLAVTGSVGKTTTKDMLFKALSPYGKTFVSKKSLNNHLGVPLSLIAIPKDATFAVLEVGMNHEGEILPLAKMIQPKIGIITAINKAHAGNMGGEIEIAKEKATLFRTLPASGTALHADFPEIINNIIAQEIPKNVKIFTVGKNLKNNLRIEKATLTSEESSCLLEYQNQSFSLQLSAPGEHLLEDAAIAIASVLALNLEPSKALKAIQQFKPGYGRGEKHLLKKNITLIDETHNASPASVRAALKTLFLQKSSRRIVILGDMLELGDFSQEEHASLLPLLVAEKIVLFCCGTAMKAIFEKLPPELQGGYAPTSEALIQPIQKYLQDGDYLLAKGSHSMRVDKVVQALKNNFSQNQTATEKTQS